MLPMPSNSPNSILFLGMGEREKAFFIGEELMLNCAEKWAEQTNFTSRHQTAAKLEGFLSPDYFGTEVFMKLILGAAAATPLSHLACWLEGG